MPESNRDINMHLRMRGEKEISEGLRRLAENWNQYRDEVEQVNDSSKETGMTTSGLTGDIAKWAAGLFSAHKAIELVTGALRAQSQAMEENAQKAAEQQKAFLRLQFLGDFFNERPDARREVREVSEFARRPFEEVAGAWYNLKSKSGGLSDEQQMGILREAAEMARTDPSLPLDTLVDMFSLYAKESKEPDANRIQNVLQQTITEAGGSGADVASYMPRFLSIGMKGGLSPAEASGLWSWATTREADPSVATTGIRNVMLSLQGKGTPESQRAMKRIGLRPGMTFDEQLDALGAASAEGKLTLPVAEQIAQREGATTLIKMAEDTANVRRIMQSVAGVDRGDIDLTRQKIETVFGQDEVARLEDEKRRQEIRIDNLKATDTRAIRNKAWLLERESYLRERGYPEWYIDADIAGYRFGAYTGIMSDLGEPSSGEPRSPQPAPVTIINNNANTNINERPPAAAPRTEGY
jgi:hypothetical protein